MGLPFLPQRIKELMPAALELYSPRHALDYCGNFADFVASRILISCWRSPDSPYFGDCRDRRGDQARHRSRCVRRSDCVVLSMLDFTRSKMEANLRGASDWKSSGGVTAFVIVASLQRNGHHGSNLNNSGCKMNSSHLQNRTIASSVSPKRRSESNSNGFADV
jgi:hypothetical protein